MIFSNAKAECECYLLHLGTPIGIFGFAGRYMPVRMEVVMAEKIVKNYMIILVIQILLTVVILFAASAIIWKCAGDESMVSAVVTGTYIIVSLVGGFTAGKMFEKNRYLWGILAGILYFAVLIAAGAAIFKTFKFESSMIINGIICMTSGMVGGMISHK